MFEIRQTIDVCAQNAPLRYAQPMYSGDADAHTWRVALVASNQAADLTGATAACYFTRPANAREKAEYPEIRMVTVTVDKANVQIEGHEAVAVFDEVCYSGVGPCGALMEITKDGATIGVASMTATLVSRGADSVYDEDVAKLVPSISELQGLMGAMVEATDDANTAAQAAAGAARRAEAGANAVAGWDGVHAVTETIEAGSDAVVTLGEDEDGNKELGFKIPRGESGVHIGPDEPTDPTVMVWIDEDGEADELPEGITPEDIQAAVNAYLDENSVASGATPEQAAQIQANTDAIEELQLGGGTAESVAWENVTGRPDKLPNPYPLTINGTAYDGSKAVSMTITGDGTTGSAPETMLGDLRRVPVYPCAQIYLDGDTTGMTKDDEVMLGIRITDEYGNAFFVGKASTSWQGSGSLAYDNKNLSLKLKNPDGSKAKISVFPDYAASTYHCKCNFLDYSMVRNPVGSRMALDFDDTAFPTDAPVTVKSIPVIVWLNGAFNGCYTLGVKQDDDLYGMDSAANPLTEIVYRWSYEAFTMQYAEYRGEADETDEIKAKIQTVIDFIRNSNDATFTAQIGNHLDLNNLINYWLYADIGCATDNMTNNFTLATWDGAKWYACWYDLDIIFGLLKDANNSRHPNKPTTVMQDVEDTKTNPLWAKLYRLFFDQIKARYWTLRESGIADATFIVDQFRTFQTKWSERNIEKDRAKWTTRPNKTADIDSMHAWIAQRLAFLDLEYGMDVTVSGSYFTSSNAAKKAAKNAAYTTQLVPSAGYAISTVVVTMGGVDVTTDVYDAATDTITIESVTGDIVITATTEQAQAYPDDITVDGDTMTIVTLANVPERSGGILIIE